MFTYHNVPEKAFSIGVDRVELDDGRAFLIALPEKALADKIRHARGLSMRTQKEYLVSSLRIDYDNLRNMNVAILESLSIGYRSKKIQILANLIRKMQK